MRPRWGLLVVGFALLQGILTLNPIPVSDEEWEEFTRQMSEQSYRLPTTTAPTRYEVSLTPYFEKVPANVPQFTFDGDVSIYIRASEANVNEIVMHCNDLTISEVTVQYTDAGSVKQIVAANQNFACEMPQAFLKIKTSEALKLDTEYTVRIKYRGNLQTNMRGFYRSWYIDSKKERRWMATTQFQPGYARQAFPCYDEPGFKAYFDITIHREIDFSPSISNMPIKGSVTDNEKGRVADTFHRTPLTSSYLIAFIVSHYTVVASGKNSERPFEIYARDNVGTTGNYGLEVGEKLLEEMEKYTDYPYYKMADKLNMKQAAIPDFNSGAMENWGLLTYREAFLLFDPVNSNNFYKQRVANIVAHEIVHMWFGNLVTCAWWDNLWLNEGFARFYQYYLTDTVEPDQGYPTRFIVEQFLMSMASDSVDSAHALTEPDIVTPDAVWAHFSTITYARGASILRMTQHLLGEQTYVKGLRAYLKEREFKVAEPEHLFKALDAAAVEDKALTAYPGITIERYFRKWSEKAGHPMLTVSVDQDTGKMTVKQARWEVTTGVSKHSHLWDIPITWTRAKAADFTNLKPSQFLTDEVTLLERGTTGNEWVIFNKQAAGYYRVNYDLTNWALLTQALRQNPKVIHPYNRAQMIDDLFNLGRAGVLPYERVFNIISFLEFDDDYAPWIAAIDGFAFVLRRLAHDAQQLQNVQKMIWNLSKAVTTRLGYAEKTGESFMDGLLRMYVMSFLCDNGHQECIAAGKSNFQKWRNGENIPANMRPWVYCVGLREGTAADFDFFWTRYQSNDLASEQVVMLQAAGCTADESSLKKFLDAIVSDPLVGEVRPQDFGTALNSAVGKNEINTKRALNWLKDNVAKTIAALGSVSTPLSYIGARLLTENDIKEYETWLDQVRPTIGKAYDTGINGATAARSNLAWSTKRMPEFVKFAETGYVEDVIPPPATEPPATDPPATDPPATDPPATDPPATDPPATDPPATDPPATDPPATDPPATDPPATDPPATDPPATDPPATDPPATDPPATDPPATDPPATDPPATDPPATDPPATDPPATDPPATDPPATDPPATDPPATDPPATDPPATDPPATDPPATDPPATDPPATDPPATDPPATDPPATDPPATDPPATDPPATDPPATDPPATDPPTDPTTDPPTDPTTPSPVPDAAHTATLSLLTLVMTIAINFMN